MAGARDDANSCGSPVDLRDARRERWAALTQVLWQISTLDRVRRCRRFRDGARRAGCDGGLDNAHHQGQRLEDLWGGLSQAWRGATGSRAARRALADVAGRAGRTESTVGANGWHLHLHALLFVPGGTTAAAAQALGETMFAGWRRRLASLGFDAPVAEDGGLDVKLLDLSEAVGAVADYVAKGSYRETPRGAVDAALELAGPGKRGRRENRATMQLLADLARDGARRRR
jgi:hypothetical protein